MKDIFYQNKNQRILELLLFLVAFSIPISFAFNSIMIAVLFLFSFSFFSSKKFKGSIKTAEVYVFYFMFFLIQVFSLLYAKDVNIALETVKQNTVFLVLPITFINLKERINARNYKAAYFGLYFAIMANVVTSIISLIHHLFSSKVRFSDFFREKFIQEGLYDIHVPYASVLIVFLIICTIDFTFTKKKQYNTFVKFFSIVIFSTSLLFLSGMMSIVILVLFYFTRFLHSNLQKSTKVVVTITTTILLGFLFMNIKNHNKIDYVRGSEHVLYRIQKIANSKDSVRQSNWKSVTKVISMHPLFGVSADGGLNLLQKERSILSESYINKHNAHNDFLEILLRYGVFGLLIFSALIFRLFQKALKEHRYVFKWFLIVFLLAGITESYLQRQIGLTFFTFFSLLLYNYKKR